MQYNRRVYNAVCEYHRNQLIAGHTFLMGMAILTVQVLLKVNNYGYNDFLQFQQENFNALFISSKF